MNEKIMAYKSKLEKMLRNVERQIALYERSKSRIMDKLKDVEDSFSRELKKGNVKVSKIAGVAPVEKTKTILKKKSDAIEKIDIPTVEMDLAPVAAAQESEDDKRKSSWNPFA